MNAYNYMLIQSMLTFTFTLTYKKYTSIMHYLPPYGKGCTLEIGFLLAMGGENEVWVLPSIAHDKTHTLATLAALFVTPLDQFGDGIKIPRHTHAQHEMRCTGCHIGIELGGIFRCAHSVFDLLWVASHFLAPAI